MKELLNLLLRYIPSFSLDYYDPEVIKFIYVLAIVFGVFLFLVLLGFTRHHIIETSLRGFWAGLWTGVIIIGLLGATTVWTMRNFVFGDKFALLPTNMQNLMFAGGEGVTEVLGITTEREQPTAQFVLTQFKLLTSIDTELVSNTICKPASND